MAQGLCQHEGCDRSAVAKGVCLKHYRAARRALTRTHSPKDGRKRSPLYQRWNYFKRTIGLVPAWDDFWRFAAEVGDRPSPKHWLRPLTRHEPFGPNNCVWQETLPYRWDDSADRSAYQKSLRAADDRYETRQTLRRYGLTTASYDALLEAQGGVCGMCKEPEKLLRYGKVQRLSVDHDHETGAVRGLLCVNCNKVLGHAHDRPEVLAAGIEYLRAHADTADNVVHLDTKRA